MLVGDDIEAETGEWKFCGDMVNYFDQHLQKSIPLYEMGHDLIIGLSDFYLKDNSICYEIGSSTGSLIYKLAKQNQDKNIKFYGVEIEDDMVRKSKTKYQLDNLEYICDDILSYEFEHSDLIIAYYLLQFIHISKRQFLVNKIYDRLREGCAFILFEKIRASNAYFQDIMTMLYNEFKQKNGYTFQEILGKSLSLKGILNPCTSDINIKMLQNAGFQDIYVIMRYVTFEGILAIK